MWEDPEVVALEVCRYDVALEWLFRTWLPQSGYVPADLPCFDAWHGRPLTQWMEYSELSAQIPVVRD